MLRRLLPLLAALVLALAAACSSEGSSGDGSSGEGAADPSSGGDDSTTTSPAGTASTTSLVPGAVGRWAVGPSELPEGWGDPDVSPERTSDPEACGIDLGDPEQVLDAITVVYEGPDGAQLNLDSTALQAADAEVAAGLLRRVVDGEVAACFERRIGEAFAEDEGIEVRDVVTGYEAIDGGGRSTVSYTLVVNGEPQPIEQEQVVLVDGPRVALLTFTAGPGGFPADLRSSLVAGVDGRLRTP